MVPWKKNELGYVIPDPGPSLAAPCPGGPIYFWSLPRILTQVVLS